MRNDGWHGEDQFCIGEFDGIKTGSILGPVFPPEGVKLGTIIIEGFGDVIGLIDPGSGGDGWGIDGGGFGIISPYNFGPIDASGPVDFSIDGESV